LKKIGIIMLAIIALLASCSDTLQETIYEKELEPGKFDHSRFGKAAFE